MGFGFTYFDVSPRLTRTEELQATPDMPRTGGARRNQTHGAVYERNSRVHGYQGV